VLYSNVVELNKEILSNPKGLYGITGAVLFVTKEGLKVLSGRQVDNISLDIRGSASNPVKDDMYLKESITDEKVCELYDYLSGSFTDYIQEAIIGFSTVFSEVIVSNPSESYSFVYNLETKSWHTITEGWSQFLLDRGYKSGMFYDVNTEGTSLPYYLQSRPWFMGTAGSKKVLQMLVRADRTIADNNYDACVVYGSNDAKTWACIGKMFITNETTSPVMRNVPGYYRYFMVAYAGHGTDLAIISIDLNFNERYTNKIR